jgi:hypothetical protein
MQTLEERLLRKRENNRNYRLRNKDKLKESYRMSRDKHIAQKAIYRETHRLEIKESQRKHYLKNRDVILEKTKAKRKANPEKLRLQKAAYTIRARVKIRNHTIAFYSVPENKIKRLVSSARRRAKDKVLSFDASIEEFLIASAPTHCPICEIAIDYTSGRGTAWENKKDSPAIDRIDSSLGYIVGNVAITCLECNTIKSCGTIERHEAVIVYMKKHLKRSHLTLVPQVNNG